MKMSYKKLWKLLIDKDMNKTDLRRASVHLPLRNSAKMRTSQPMYCSASAKHLTVSLMTSWRLNEQRNEG